ncbi:MAG TPA: BamA/TamA family outer membrane protein [Chitinophagaceae bacterium]|nr:BamA/TamA family outer membrane protein [Chitinophagaceae bacterium]
MKITTLLALLLPSSFLFAQDSITHRIVLIGDAGQLTNGRHPVALAVKQTIPMDARTTIVYLGDNLYKVGLPDDEMPEYNRARAVLDSQLSIAQGTRARIYMIPGNHDWNNGGRYGYDAVIREQLYVDLLNKDNVKFYPEGGCPGPVEVLLGNDVALVILDSQWWLHPFDKPGIESDCEFKTKDEVLSALDDVFSRNSKKLIILAVHHTFQSSSPHGGFYTWKQHIFPFTDVYKNAYIPLPVIGSIYPITRGIFGTPQDLKHPNYENMIDTIQKVAKAYKNVIFAGGHDHSLQLIKDSNYYYITSGSGAKTNRVYKSRKSLFAASLTGFAVLEVSRNKNVRCNFYTVTDSTRLAYSENILNFTSIEEPQEDSINRPIEDPFLKYKDTFTISASEKYRTNSAFKKFVMGNNYRQEWSTPVNMRVLNIRKEKGGLTPRSLGGGKQTRSLRLVDKNGKEWTLRSVEKDPSRAIPEAFRPTVARDIVRDFISASHPYASMAMPRLADAVNVVVPRPELFFVPDDPALGPYRAIFKNSICLLEEHEPARRGQDVFNTTTTFHNMLNDNDHRVDEFAVLRARLLDMLVADFDRHADQWKWAQGDTGQGKIYYPISRDHDQAFFYSDGLLIKIVTLKNLPFLKGLRYDIPKVEELNLVAKDFDRMFLTDLEAEEWRATIRDMQENLTDDVIRAAVRDLPAEVHAISGETIAQKLISRRNILEEKGMEYYRFLARKVDVVGSNEKEYFRVTSSPEGLNIKVYERKANNDTSFLMYDRTFDQQITREVRLYGLNGDDLFEIDDNASSRIRLRIVGGKGNDTFNIRGRVRNHLYDRTTEGNINYIQSQSLSKNHFSDEPLVNYYSSTGFRYDELKLPSVFMTVNSDDGFLIGTGISWKTYGFRKDPYATFQKVLAMYSPARGSVQFRYNGEFNKIIGDYDLVVQGQLGVPGVINFFGLGNNTSVADGKPISFYRSRYRYLETSVLIQRRRYESLRLMAGPVYYSYWNRLEDNAGKVLGAPSLVGLDSTSVYSTRNFLGGRAAMIVYNLNNELFPTRGVDWRTDITALAGLRENPANLVRLQSDMEIYASLSDPARLVAVIRLGGGHIFNRQFDYYHALNIGAQNHLRGFRKNRFAGNSLAYGGLELRLKLADVRSYILPGSFGIIGFNEAGRVWLRGESSRKWHYAYGGGLYFIPFELFIMSATVGFSKEESRLFNFSIGTKLNLNF